MIIFFKNKKIISTAVIMIGILLFAGIASSYTARPNCVPSICNSLNALPPINEDSMAQYKTGSLALGTSSAPTSGASLDVNGTINADSLLSFGDVIVNNPSFGNYRAQDIVVDKFGKNGIRPLCVDSSGLLTTVCPPPSSSPTSSHGVAIFDQNGTWNVPATGVSQITVEMWGAGGAGYINYSSSSTAPTDTVLTDNSGSGQQLVALAGSNATSSGPGIGGTTGGSNITSVIGNPETHIGGNGQGAPSVATPFVYDCGATNPGYSILYGNNGGYGAIGGASYLGQTSSTPGGQSISNNIGTLDQSCANIPSGAQATSGNSAQNQSQGVSSANNGVAPGGGGSTPSGQSGIFGWINETESNYLSLSVCNNYFPNTASHSVCLGFAANDFYLTAPSHVTSAYGGGAGGYMKAIISVTPSEQLSFTVGQGGTRTSTLPPLTIGSGANGRVKISW